MGLKGLNSFKGGLYRRLYKVRTIGLINGDTRTYRVPIVGFVLGVYLESCLWLKWAFWSRGLHMSARRTSCISSTRPLGTLNPKPQTLRV